MKGIIIKPKKKHYAVIDKKDCIGCIYNPATKKMCKSCGNFKL
jgi:hypothetical protein